MIYLYSPQFGSHIGKLQQETGRTIHSDLYALDGWPIALQPTYSTLAEVFSIQYSSFSSHRRSPLIVLLPASIHVKAEPQTTP